jgi:hypothetical protein
MSFSLARGAVFRINNPNFPNSIEISGFQEGVIEKY